MIFFKIDLIEVRESLNIQYSEKGKGTEVCLLCGKRIKNYDALNTKQVHLTTDGYLVPVDIEVENSQGLHPVGNGCANKLKNLFAITT